MRAPTTAVKRFNMKGGKARGGPGASGGGGRRRRGGPPARGGSGRGYFFNIASRRALKVLPAFHSGQVGLFATASPTRRRNSVSCAAPSNVQSGFTSSET